MNNGFQAYRALATVAVALLFAVGCQNDQGSVPVDQGAASRVQSEGIGTDSPVDKDMLVERPTGITWTGTGLITPLLGGTVTVLSSSLVVPPTAVISQVQVTFSISTSMPQGLAGALKRTYTFLPEGTRFLIPARLIVPFSDAGLNGQNPNHYSFFYHNKEINRWEIQNTIVDPIREQFIVDIYHFSQYAFGRNQ